jgi:hypothetical protein
VSRHGHSWAESLLAREEYRTLKQVEREVFPRIQEIERELARPTPRRAPASESADLGPAFLHESTTTKG